MIRQLSKATDALMEVRKKERRREIERERKSAPFLEKALFSSVALWLSLPPGR